MGKVGHTYGGSQGEAVERYAYTPYGEMVVLDSAGAPKASQVPLQPYGYTGRRYDSETGLWYFRTRYFDAELGQFIGRDSWRYDSTRPLSMDGYLNGLSLYAPYFAPNGLDPYGYYDIHFKRDWGDPAWTLPWIVLVEDSLKNIETRLVEFIEEVDVVLEELSTNYSEDKYNCLYRRVEHLKRTLLCVHAKVQSEAFILEIRIDDDYHNDEAEAYAPYRHNMPAGMDRVYFNSDFVGGNPMNFAQDRFDKIMFHELLHHCDTHDGEEEGEDNLLNNSHYLDDFMNEDKFTMNNSLIKAALKYAGTTIDIRKDYDCCNWEEPYR
jgi:RHS repeat-associated protein